MENPFVLGLSLVSDDEASRYLLSFQEFGVFQNIVRMNFYGSSDQVKFRYLANMKSSVHDVIEREEATNQKIGDFSEAIQDLNESVNKNMTEIRKAVGMYFYYYYW